VTPGLDGRFGHKPNGAKRLPIEIRDAVPADGPTIADYNARMARETEDKVLDPDMIGPGVAAVLEDLSKGRYWVAMIDGDIAGQLMVSYEWSDWRNGTIWWIQSVYVAAPFRRRGVFSALYKHVESLARQDETVSGIRLYVEKGNTRAKDTYLSLGMTMTEYDVMEAIFDKGVLD
jgi:GNAT superfamily N-acetyltransferase